MDEVVSSWWGRDAAMKPPLNWVGGKQQHLDALRKLIPAAASGGFHEPFIGGASVFLTITPHSGTINDLNPRLINFYRQVRDHPARLVARCRAFRRPGAVTDPSVHRDPMGNRDEWPEDVYFYQQRARLNAADAMGLPPLERAALFFYINRCSYNALYRENSDGNMNMARGSRENPNWVREARIRACSYSLGGGTSAGSTITGWSRGDRPDASVDPGAGTPLATTTRPEKTDGGRDMRPGTDERIGIHEGDFAYITDVARPGDVVYFDPPYQPKSETADFTDYTAGGFSSDDRHRLWGICTELAERDITVIVSDSGDTAPNYRELGFEVRLVDGKSCVGIDPDSRGTEREVVALRYAPEHDPKTGTQTSLGTFGE